MGTSPPIPTGELGPLVVQMTAADAPALIAFLRQVFDADELYRNLDGDGRRITHCELLVAGTRVVVHDEFPEFGLLSPLVLGGTAASYNLYLDEIDTVFARAVQAGGQALAPPRDQFWGVRSAAFLDPSGHRWVLSAVIADLSPDEILQRSEGAPTHARLSAAPKPEDDPG